jgi:hypothetical protein
VLVLLRPEGNRQRQERQDEGAGETTSARVHGDLVVDPEFVVNRDLAME